MPAGICECGCGQVTKLCTHTDKSRGLVKGESQRFIVGHQGFLRKSRNRCPNGHAITLENSVVSAVKGSSTIGTNYRPKVKCKICEIARGKARRLTLAGQIERILERLKKAGLSDAELLRAQPLILEFFSRPLSERICPICGYVCEAKWRTAADHCHVTLRFRAMICRYCNAALGYARDREDLLGDGKLGQYVKQHRAHHIACAGKE
jgi:rubrerythrin